MNVSQSPPRSRKRRSRRTVAYGSLLSSYQAAMARKGTVPRLPMYRTRGRVSYARKARLQTGESTIVFPAKASTVKSDGFVSRASNDLIEVNPLNIARVSTTNQDLNTRLTDVIYLSGFKVNMCVRNTRTVATTAQLFFNIALVSTKAGTNDISTLDFFTSGGGTTRSYNFDNVNYTTLERHRDPINSDRYVVHWHERYVLLPWANGASAGSGILSNSIGKELNQTAVISKYIPIKRQIRFDSSSASSAEPEFRVVFWVGIPGEGYTDPIVQTADQFQTDHSITAYYREP